MICLLEDDDNIRKLVSFALKKEGYEVIDFDEPNKFWESIKDKKINLIILDVMLPTEDGLTIIKKLKNNIQYKNIPVIFLSAKGSEYDKVTGLDLGADDYISKPFGMTEFISRVKAVLRRFNSVDKNEYNIGNLYVDFNKHIIKVNDKEVDFSYKEYQLLIMLLKADGNVVSREKILTEIWGEFYEESRTLDMHIRKLRQKIENSNVSIKTIKNIGYKLEVINEK